jgi:hypothetical protein
VRCSASRRPLRSAVYAAADPARKNAQAAKRAEMGRRDMAKKVILWRGLDAIVPLFASAQAYYIRPRGTETEVSMKGLVSALAAGSLLIFPLTAASQGRTAGHSMAGEDMGGGGGGHVGGGHVGGGHFGGGELHGGFDHGRFGHGGFDHGFDRGGFHHFHHFDNDDFFPFFGGFAFGLALDPWFYGGYWGPWGPYSGNWYYDYYDGPYDGGSYGNVPYYNGPPTRGATPQACGQWDVTSLRRCAPPPLRGAPPPLRSATRGRRGCAIASPSPAGRGGGGGPRAASWRGRSAAVLKVSARQAPAPAVRHVAGET